ELLHGALQVLGRLRDPLGDLLAHVSVVIAEVGGRSLECAVAQPEIGQPDDSWVAFATGLLPGRADPLGERGALRGRPASLRPPDTPFHRSLAGPFGRAPDHV